MFPDNNSNYKKILFEKSNSTWVFVSLKYKLLIKQTNMYKI